MGASSCIMVERRVVDQRERRDAQKVRREGEARASPRASPKDTDSATARQSLVKEKKMHRAHMFPTKRCLFRRAISSASNRRECTQARAWFQIGFQTQKMFVPQSHFISCKQARVQHRRELGSTMEPFGSFDDAYRHMLAEEADLMVATVAVKLGVGSSGDVPASKHQGVSSDDTSAPKHQGVSYDGHQDMGSGSLNAPGASSVDDTALGTSAVADMRSDMKKTAAHRRMTEEKVADVCDDVLRNVHFGAAHGCAPRMAGQGASSTSGKGKGANSTPDPQPEEPCVPVQWRARAAGASSLTL